MVGIASYIFDSFWKLKFSQKTLMTFKRNVWYSELNKAKKDTYCTHAIITRGLYIFYPIFHFGLYCTAVSVTDNLCAKQGNSSIFVSKILGL